MSVGQREEPGGARGRTLWLVVLAAALLPSLGTLRAPWIAEDASVLARVAEEGAWADWNRPWFGMEIVRFWRPLVTSSWALQYAWTGLEPLYLRLFNLGLHAGCALLAFASLRRLGGGSVAALAAGLSVAWFPEQGGTVTWLSGRTDLLCGFFLLAAVVAALGRRPWLAFPLAFLAAASKEFGFLAPAWCALFACARGDGVRECGRRALPAFLAAGVAFGWRWFALGTLSGGYAGAQPAPWVAVAGAARALFLVPSIGLVAYTLVAFLLATHLRGASAWRAPVALLGAALLALVPLLQVLGDGELEPQNARLLFVPFLALACCAGAALARSTPGLRAVLAALLVGLSGVSAWRDTREWRDAAEECARRIEAARAEVAGLAPGDAPALFRDFPESLAGAYALKFGLAERFRAPFPSAPRPVWPWRLLFVADAARERSALVAPRAGGLLLPLDDVSSVAPLTLTAEGLPLGALRVDERALPRGADESLVLELAGVPGGAALELVLLTELGYEPFALAAADADGRARFSLRAALQRANGATLAIQVLAQAHDLGARRAYAEFRALGADGRVLAASRWVELTWPPDLAER